MLELRKKERREDKSNWLGKTKRFKIIMDKYYSVCAKARKLREQR